MGRAKMHGNSEKEGAAWGHGKFANMPTDVKMDQYAKANEYGPSDLDDTMTEIDRVNSFAHKRSRSHMSNQH